MKTRTERPPHGPSALLTRGSRARTLPWLAAVLLTAAIALVLLGFYLWIYPSKRFTVPLGWDTSRYLWRTTLMKSVGIANLQASVPPGVRADPARPAFPVVAASLSALGRVTTFRMAAILPGVMAAVVGLAAGAFVSASLRRPWWALAAVALGVGTSAFVVRLLGPETYQDNLLAGGAFLAAATAMGFAVEDRRALIPAVLLFGASGVVHWSFYAYMLATVALGAVAYAPASWRSWRSGDAALWDTPAARLGEVAAGGTALAAAFIFGVIGSGARTPRLSETEFLKKFQSDVPRYRFPVTGPLAALGALSLVRVARGAPDADAARAGRARFVAALLLAWCIVALAGVLAFQILHVDVPAHRFLAFALAIPILGIIALLWVAGLLARRGLAAVGAAVAIGVIGWSAYLSHVQWFRTTPWIDPAKIDDASVAATYLETAGVPADTPVVFLVREVDPSNAALMGNMIRAVLPAERIRHSYLYAGSPEFYLEERPTPRSHEGLSERYFTYVEPTYDERPVALLLKFFDGHYFEPWARAHPETLVAPDVAVVRGPVPREPLPPATPPLGTLTLAQAAVLGVGTFAALWLIGIGWTAALLGRWARPFETVALSPAVGVAALVLGGVVVDRLGVRLTGTAGALTPVAVAVAGWVPVVLARRRRHA